MARNLVFARLQAPPEAVNVTSVVVRVRPLVPRAVLTLPTALGGDELAGVAVAAQFRQVGQGRVGWDLVFGLLAPADVVIGGLGLLAVRQSEQKLNALGSEHGDSLWERGCARA
ncbi:MAG: hypothetical protein ABFD90_10610 [Phycisphaerales bacterium]